MKLLNKLFPGIGIVGLLLVSSCQLINFEMLSIDIYPGSHNQIIPVDSKLSLRFNIPPEKKLVESMFSCSDVHGIPVQGYGQWEKQNTKSTYVFTPYLPLQEGMKYSLSFSGTVITEDGRTFTVRNEYSFYAGRNGNVPILLDYSPASSSVVSIFEPIILTFSSAMDTIEFENSFSLSPGNALLYNWSNDNTVVTIRPTEKWSNKSLHQWTLDTNTKTAEGLHLIQSYSGRFLVQEDVTNPLLDSISLCFFNRTSNRFDSLPGLNIETDMTNNHSLLLEFNEAVEYSSIQCTFNPDVDAYLIEQSPRRFIFKINDSFLPAENYELCLRKGIRDLSGNSTQQDYIYQITPAIPAQKITSIYLTADKGAHLSVPLENLNTEAIHTIPGTTYLNDTNDKTDQSIVIEIELEFPIEDYISREYFVESIHIQKLFPLDGESSSPYIAQAFWDPSNKQLSLHVFDFEYSNVLYGYSYLYSVCISSSARALAENGSYLKEDQTFYMESITK